jgi:hypothetical protein
MSYKAEVYKVMIASPGDVKDERKIIREVLSEWNAINSEMRKIVLLPVGWETHSSPEMGERGQAIINEQLKDCDLLIGVFWTRIGTATGEYQSGSVEEIQRHIEAKKPVMLYFSSVPVALDNVDHAQYSELQNFKQLCEQDGLFGSYSNKIDFRSDFNRQLRIKLNSMPFTEQDQAEIQLNNAAQSTQKKYDRLIKEMDELVGPLFSKMDDHTAPYFQMVHHSSEASQRIQEMYAFWRNIKVKIYLAPEDLRMSLNIYLDARQKFRMVGMDRKTPDEELTATKALFYQAIDDLKSKIKDRYDELSKLIEECEKILEIS